MGVGTMITCREVSEILSRDTLGAQPLRRRVGVRLHLLICKYCLHFARQLRALRAASRAAAADFDREAPALERKIADAMRANGAARRRAKPDA